MRCAKRERRYRVVRLTTASLRASTSSDNSTPRPGPSGKGSSPVLGNQHLRNQSFVLFQIVTADALHDEQSWVH